MDQYLNACKNVIKLKKNKAKHRQQVKPLMLCRNTQQRYRYYIFYIFYIFFLKNRCSQEQLFLKWNIIFYALMLFFFSPWTWTCTGWCLFFDVFFSCCCCCSPLCFCSSKNKLMSFFFFFFFLLLFILKFGKRELREMGVKGRATIMYGSAEKYYLLIINEIWYL